MSFHRARLARFFGCLAVVLLALAHGAPIDGAEPPDEGAVRAHLERLRQQTLFDDALEYLDALESEDRLPPEIKETVDYERGITLVGAIGIAQELPERQERAAAASRAFAKFLDAHPTHAQSIDARGQMAAAIAEQARILVLLAGREESSTKKTGQQAEARRLFQQAGACHERIRVDLRQKLLDFPRQGGNLALRDSLRGDYVQTQLLAATILYQTASTYETGSKEHRLALETAAEAFHAVHEKYSVMLGGLYALLLEGRCYYDAGQIDRAIDSYDELLNMLPETPGFRALRTKTLCWAVPCWLAAKPKRYNRAIRVGDAWLAQENPAERQQADSLALAYYVALAHKLKADSRVHDAEKKPHLEQAGLLAGRVAGVRGEYRDLARKLLQALDLPETTKTPPQDRKPNDADMP